MCVYSLIVDHYREKWEPRRTHEWIPTPIIFPPQPQITQEELAEFRRLLEKAKEYDKRMNQPDCELDSKKEKLTKLAKDLGVEISFP